VGAGGDTAFADIDPEHTTSAIRASGMHREKLRMEFNGEWETKNERQVSRNRHSPLCWSMMRDGGAREITPGATGCLLEAAAAAIGAEF